MKQMALLLALISGWSWAQVPFTIVRPQNGARVREQVEIRIPLRSVPAGGFIGVTIDDKFVEAVATSTLTTDQNKKQLVYVWDTKAKNVPDGKHKIELTLYAPGGEGQAPRMLDRSSVTVQVENKIKNIPADGILLQYQWKPGRALLYQDNWVLKNVSEIKQSGLRPSEEILVDAKGRVSLNILDMNWQSARALVSWILAPPVQHIEYGQILTLPEGSFAPVYQEVDPSGRVQYQARPRIEGGSVRWVYVGDLPYLLPRKVKAGDRWSTEIVLYDPLVTGNDLEAMVLARIPCAAKLESFEWEKGYKCAKITYELTGNIPRLKLGSFSLEKPKVKFNRVVYFAYDIGQVVRSTLTIEMEVTVREQMRMTGGLGSPAGAGYAPGQFGGGYGLGGGYGPGGAGMEEEDKGFVGRGGFRGGRGGGIRGGQPGAPGGMAGGPSVSGGMRAGGVPGAPMGGFGQPQGGATMPGQETTLRTIVANEFVLIKVQ